MAQNIQAMRHTAKHLLKTVVAVIILTIPMSMTWDAIFPGRIYFCTDDVGLDYLQPGNWVHGEIESVDDVESASSRSMGDPDVILRGWTTERLWMSWSTLFGVSLVIAHLLARLSWIPRSLVPKNQSANKSWRANRA